MEEHSELVQLLNRGCESLDLDYKGPMIWDENDKKACCELVKDILALANTKGGFLVIGVQEEDTGFVPMGLTEAQLASFETSRLSRFLTNYSDPPIHTTLRKLKRPATGQQFVVVEVPRFPDLPHICIKDYPKVLQCPTIYVRTANNESAPLSNASDLQDLIETATRNRANRLLTSFRAILKGEAETSPTSDVKQFMGQLDQSLQDFDEKNPYKDKAYGGYLETCFYPRTFDLNRCDLRQLRTALEKATIDYRGFPFLFVHDREMYTIQDGIQCLIRFQDFRQNDRLDFWQLHTSGFFFQRRLMWEESAYPESPRLDVVGTTYYVAEAVDCMIRLCESLGIADPMTLRLRLLGTKGRLLYSARWPLHDEYVSQISQITEEMELPLEEWKAGQVSLSVKMIDNICQKFNWANPNTAVFRTDVENLLNRRV